MIKGLFFDFYGTIGIYNNLEFADDQTLYIISEYLNGKCKFDKNDLKINWKYIFSKKISLKETDGKSIFMYKLNKLYNLFNLYPSDDELGYIACRCLNTWHSHISLPINIHNTLEQLSKKYKLAIISNFDHPSALRCILNQNKLVNYFDYIAISGEIGYNKPDKLIFDKVLEELNLKPEEVIFVGDSIVDDIQGSSNIRMKSILIDMNNRHMDYEGWKIAKLCDLLEINSLDYDNLAKTY